MSNNYLNTKSSYIFYISLFVLTLLMIYCFMPLDKINSGHDSFFHFRRISILIQSIHESRFPSYIDYTALNNYGYGTKWFYPDLILLPIACLTILTNYVFAYKTTLFIITFLCGLFTYILIYRIYKNYLAAFLGAILFTFSTNRLEDVYIRGAIGEVISFTLLPIIFLGLYEIIKGNYRKWYILSMGFFLLMRISI